ncbi:deaminase [Nocardiopsis sp. TSRI0078]|uniref:dihydrofolate reductase family protein n=1 Tax=unclassified Nocardiopsis TaxID=2649073 RepID=UPI00093C6807|nr:dihydrofolate reductase family protein [Nocardiopsis sp. TSRI0078]OKI12270.1 deaminase [Nocardiopsis sp. TSRI0078]
MGQLVHFVHQSLDGFIEGPGGEFDWPEMGPELSAYSQSLNDTADAFLYGRVVWDMMSGYWPRAEELSTHEHDLAFAPVWRDKPKVVVSRTLESADWNTRVIGRDVPGRIAALKESGTNLVLFGGSGLAATLTEHGLIDEYRIVVHPVVLGGGRPVFQEPKERLGLELVESRVFDSRSVLLRHRRA